MNKGVLNLVVVLASAVAISVGCSSSNDDSTSSSGGSGGKNAAGGSGGSAGTSGSAGTTGAGGSTGSAGASGSGDCTTTCTKAQACCLALSPQLGLDAGTCQYDNATLCSAAAGTNGLQACQSVLTSGAQLNASACK